MTTLPEPEPLSSAELHHSTADYLDQVRGGHSFVVTRYGRPVAVLLPPQLYEQLLTASRKTTS